MAEKSNGLRVAQRKLESITPYERNPRAISDAAVEKVALSIQQFGWRQPIVVDGEGVIVAGHARYLAAQRLGLDKVDVHVASDLSAEQIKSYRLADNRSGEEAQWNMELLSVELSELHGALGNPDNGTSGDLALTGFDGEELSELLGLDGVGEAAAAEAESEDNDEDDDEGGAVQSTFQVVAECPDEATQQAVYELVQGHAKTDAGAGVKVRLNTID